MAGQDRTMGSHEYGGSTGDEGMAEASLRNKVCGGILSCNGLLAATALSLVADKSNAPPVVDSEVPKVRSFLGEPGAVGFLGVAGVDGMLKTSL